MKWFVLFSVSWIWTPDVDKADFRREPAGVYESAVDCATALEIAKPEPGRVMISYCLGIDNSETITLMGDRFSAQ